MNDPHRVPLFHLSSHRLASCYAPGADLTVCGGNGGCDGIRVRLVDWHDSSKSADVVASTLQQLRSMVEDTTKLYFYDVRNGRVPGTERVKLVGDSEFTVLKQQPADVRPVTVYYYTRRDGEEDPDSQSRGVLQECFRYQIRQRPLRQSDKTTDIQSVRKGCAIAARVPAWWNLDLMNPYRDPHGSSPPRHVQKTYRICSATT